MIPLATFAAAAIAIVVSEVAGRSVVAYARVSSLVAGYVLGCAVSGAAIVRLGAGPLDVAAVVATAVPIMGAWLGFRIHLTNSISLELAHLLDRDGEASEAALAAAYDVTEHVRRRVVILQEAGYLGVPGGGLIDSPRNRAVLRLVRVACGLDGPAAVAAQLREGQRRT